jgi:hypothetical protein
MSRYQHLIDAMKEDEYLTMTIAKFELHAILTDLEFAIEARTHDAQPAQVQRGKTSQYRCHCGAMFTARVADRKRGWARFCSKSCKAVQQERCTGQYRDFLNGAEGDLCFPSQAGEDIQP